MYDTCSCTLFCTKAMLLATAGAFSRSLVACSAPAATGNALTASSHKAEMLQSCKIYISEGRDATVIGRLKVRLHSACMQSSCTKRACASHLQLNMLPTYSADTTLFVYLCSLGTTAYTSSAGPVSKPAEECEQRGSYIPDRWPNARPVSMQWRCGKGRTLLGHPT